MPPNNPFSSRPTRISREELILRQTERENRRKQLRSNWEIFETFAVEIENSMVRPTFNLPEGFSFSHDASTFTPIKATSSFLKVNKEASKYLRVQTKTFGCEVISTYPLKLNDEEDILAIKEVLDNMYLYGGESTSERSGIHIHITVPKSLKILKNILIHAVNNEDIFYYLGGMGQEFRGIHNGSIYCRPMTKKGPPVVRGKSSRTYAQVLNVRDLLESSSLEEFAERYGNILNTGVRHYPPSRYTWINFVTIFRQGSLEYRVFNTTIASQILKATIAFCLDFTKYCLIDAFTTDETELDVHSIFSEHSKESILERFLELANRINLSEKYTQILYEGIVNVPKIELVNEYVFSHLMYHAQGDRTNKEGYWRYSDYSPPKLELDEDEEIKVPHFVDIHNISRSQ